MTSNTHIRRRIERLERRLAASDPDLPGPPVPDLAQLRADTTRLVQLWRNVVGAPEAVDDLEAALHQAAPGSTAC